MMQRCSEVRTSGAAVAASTAAFHVCAVTGCGKFGGSVSMDCSREGGRVCVCLRGRGLLACQPCYRQLAKTMPQSDRMRLAASSTANTVFLVLSIFHAARDRLHSPWHPTALAQSRSSPNGRTTAVPQRYHTITPKRYLEHLQSPVLPRISCPHVISVTRRHRHHAGGQRQVQLAVAAGCGAGGGQGRRGKGRAGRA